MKKHFCFLPLLFLSLTLFLRTGWGQFLNTLYTHREIGFFTEEEELEGYNESQFQLIPHTEIYVSLNPGIGFISEKDHFTHIQNLINDIKDSENQNRESTNQLRYFRENNVKPYQFGFNLEVFIYKYFGAGFTYKRSHYFSHLASVAPPDGIDNYYNESIGYKVNAFGNNFQLSLMGRYPFGKRHNYNIFLVGGMGYTYATLGLKVQLDNQIDSQVQKQEYSSSSHSFHLFTELIFKVEHFNFGFGLLMNTISFTDYTYPDNPQLSDFTPPKYEAIKLGPVLYFKVGFNL